MSGQRTVPYFAATLCMLALAHASFLATSSDGDHTPDRRLLQENANVCENIYQRTIEKTGVECCFPYNHDGIEHDNCFVIEDQAVCAPDANGGRGQLMPCAPSEGVTVVSDLREEDTENNNEDPLQDLREGFNATAPAMAPARELPDGVGDKWAPAPGMEPEARYAKDPPHARCYFPAPAPNGTEVYGCFPKVESAEVADATFDEEGTAVYCYTDDAFTEEVQCAGPDFEPPAPPECDEAKQKQESENGECTFPQWAPITKSWSCDCYNIHLKDSESHSEDSTRLYCEVDVTKRMELCKEQPTPISEQGATPDADDEGDSEDGDSSNSSTDGDNNEGDDDSTTSGEVTYVMMPEDDNSTLAIALGVGIPLGLLALAALVGGAWWYKKKRPMAKAKSFTKYQGDDAVKGGSISHRDVQNGSGQNYQGSKYAEPI